MRIITRSGERSKFMNEKTTGLPDNSPELNQSSVPPSDSAAERLSETPTSQLVPDSLPKADEQVSANAQPVSDAPQIGVQPINDTPASAQAMNGEQAMNGAPVSKQAMNGAPVSKQAMNGAPMSAQAMPDAQAGAQPNDMSLNAQAANDAQLNAQVTPNVSPMGAQPMSRAPQGGAQMPDAPQTCAQPMFNAPPMSEQPMPNVRKTCAQPMPDAPQGTAYGTPEPPSDVNPPLLEILDVSKSYSGQKVLKGLSFTLSRGGVIGLLGPNGSGKTTVLKLIAGLLVPDSGSIRVNGMAPSPETASSIAFLPERDFLPSGAKVSYLVDYYADFFSDFDRRKAYEMLGRLGVSEKARMRTLSKGTREKVRLILVMSRRAELYLLDEPLGGVDPAAREYILDTIFSNYSAGCSILISTHLISDIERGLNDVIFMADGRAAFCASVRSIREKYGKSVDELFREVYRC